ncbi:MAG: protein kinase [Fuerstiella sp.]|nr:protein kinase [Fuerstiella sp.]MCP4854270.1 protein kinase [Fuerstiella sp.]
MNAQTADHPTAAQLSDFVLGRLAMDTSDRVVQHIESCQSCCESLQGIPDDHMVHLARAAVQPVRHADTGMTGIADTNPDAAANQRPVDVMARLSDHPRYRILEPLGAGGMGEVFKAEHRLMDRTVAVKVIRGEFMTSPTAVSRFRTEVRAASRLSHPNIVTVHDAEQAGDMHLLVMEYVEGISLDRLVEKRGPLSSAKATEAVRSVALGLQHAHEHRLVHRDIKPQNLITTPDNNVKILDFGLARFITMTPEESEPQESVGITAANLALGTPDYIAPEQADNARSADIRADIYSLGCTFYFLLTGRPPFPTGSHLQKISSHMLLEPTPLAEADRSIPPGVNAIVRKMMAKSVSDRFQTPSEVVAAIDELEIAESPSVISQYDSRRPNTSAAQLPGRVVVGVLLLLAVVAGGYGVSGLWPAATDETTDPNGHVAGRQEESKFPDKTGLTGLPRIDGMQVLFVMPQQTYYPDYVPVRRILEAQGGDIKTASPGLSITPTEDDPGQPFQADLLISDVDPEAFDAVVFVGGQMEGLDDEAPANVHIRRILAVMDDDHRVVAGICLGMIALSDAAYFEGHSIAALEQIQHEFTLRRATPSRDDVVTSGRLITAADADFAEQFAETIVWTLARVP